MKITVNPDRSVKKEYGENEINDGSQNENRVTTISFEVPEDYSDFTKRIVFITKDGNYFDEIANDEYVLKNNITKYKKLAAFVWLINTTTHQDFRSEVFPLEFNYNENFSDSVPSEQEISQIEILFEQLENLIEEVESIENLTYEIVEELPTENIDPHVIYMVLREGSEPNNIYDEWMYINEEWELIGATAIDLQPLQKEIDEINEMLFTHTTAESENSEVTLNGNSNLEMNITELDGKIEQDSTQGYQLISLKDGTYTGNSGVTIKVENGKCTINGTPSASEIIPVQLKDNLSLTNGQTYTLYGFNDVANSNVAFRPRIDEGFFQIAFDTTNKVESKTYNGTSISVAYIGIRVGSGTTITNLVCKPMLISGNDTTKSYEKYTGEQASPNPDYQQEIKVVTGTQDVAVSGINLLNRSLLEQGGMSGQPEYYGLNFESTSRVRTNYVEVLPNTTYSISINDTGKVIVYLFEYNSNKIASEAVPYVPVNSSTHTFTTASTTHYIRVAFGNSDSSNIVPSDVTEAQIEQGNQATTYEPYITPITKQVHLGDIELAKIGTYKDKIYPSGGKWYLHKEIGKVVLDGTEGWSLNQTSTNTYRFVADTVISNARANTAVTAGFFNNLFQKYAGNVGIGSIDVEGIAIRDSFNGFTIRANISRVTDLAGFKAWLSTHNTIVYYILATPTDTEITGTLKEELDALQKLQQLNGTTIVSIEGNLSADFKLVYENDSISDLNTRVGNIESNYVKDTDYATDNSYGLVKTGYGLQLSNGNTYAQTLTYQQYSSAANGTFVGKETLNNVLNARIGDINSLLDEINRGGDLVWEQQQKKEHIHYRLNRS